VGNNVMDLLVHLTKFISNFYNILILEFLL